MVQTEARNATLADLAALLKDQQARKLDVVAPANTIRSSGASLIIDGTGSISPHPERGLAEGPGTFTPTTICDEGIAGKLGIPQQYVKRMRAERPDLYDANVNGWLRGDGNTAEPDARNFLVRCFKGDDDDSGIARAFLSDGFGMIDNLDVLTAGLEGIRESGAEVQVVACDLTERRMYVKVVAPAVRALAPALFRGYRNPFDDPGVDNLRRHGRANDDLAWLRRAAAAEGLGYEPGKEPIVFAGFVLSNSETGGGAFTITPRVVAEICGNGATVSRDAMRKVHLGSRLDEGLVKWTEDTQQKMLALVTAQARDAVATFLDPAYVQRIVAEIEEKAGAPISRPQEQVKTVGKQLGFSDDRIDGVLDHFIRGGQMTAGGVLNAVTSYAQTIADPDEANTVEGQGLRALELAAALR